MKPTSLKPYALFYVLLLAACWLIFSLPVSAQQIDLTKQVKGILPVVNGGTGPSMTAASVPYINSSGFLTQDNTHMSYGTTGSLPYGPTGGLFLTGTAGGGSPTTRNATATILSAGNFYDVGLHIVTPPYTTTFAESALDIDLQSSIGGARALRVFTSFGGLAGRSQVSYISDAGGFYTLTGLFSSGVSTGCHGGAGDSDDCNIALPTFGPNNAESPSMIVSYSDVGGGYMSAANSQGVANFWHFLALDRGGYGRFALNEYGDMMWGGATTAQLSQFDTGLARIDASTMEFNNRTPGVQIDLNVRHLLTGGTAPHIVSGDCGATTNGTVSGSDASGTITIGSAATASCKVTFGTAYTVAPKSCVFSAASAGAAAVIAAVYRSALTTTYFTLTGTAIASTVWDYQCF